MRKLRSIIIVLFATISAMTAASTFPTDDSQPFRLFALLEEEGARLNLDESTISLAQAVLAVALTDEEVYNRMKGQNGQLKLDEETAMYGVGKLKDKLKNVAISTVNYALEKYDKAQDKLDDVAPVVRNKIADALVVINDGLSKIDPKIISTFVGAAAGVAGAASTYAGAAFGAPIIPGLAITLATCMLGNSYTISGALAGAKTLIDIAESVLRVDPNASATTVPGSASTDQQKGDAIKKIGEAMKFVGQHYVDNFAVYKPDDVELIKKAAKKSTEVLSLFM